jgi:hypothetical protein
MNTPVANFEERLHHAKDGIFAAFAQLESLVKQRGAPDEITSAALVWIARLRWAVEDAYEFKTRRMAMNPAEEAQTMLGPFLTLLEALTTEIKQMLAILETHNTISPSLMESVGNVGKSLQPQFYHC